MSVNLNLVFSFVSKMSGNVNGKVSKSMAQKVLILESLHMLAGAIGCFLLP